MNTRHTVARPCADAFSLLECIVYIGVLMVILALGMEAYYRVDHNAREIAGNAADILGVVHAGERWRADVRGATGGLRVEQTPEGMLCRIPQGRAEVRYAQRAGGIWREVPGERAPELVVSRVVGSQMLFEPREPIPAWRWELELKSTRKGARVRPLFSFLVPATNTTTVASTTP